MSQPLPHLPLTLLLLTGLTALSFPPKHPLTLTLLVALLLALSTLTWRLSAAFFPDDFVHANVLRFILMYDAHVLYMLLCVRPGEEGGDLHGGLVDGSGRGSGRWYKGYKLLFNPRGVGTRWEVRDLRVRTDGGGGKGEHDEKEEEKRGRGELKREDGKEYWKTAIATRLVRALLYYMLLCLYYDFVDLRAYMLISTSDFSPARETLLRRLFTQPSSSSSSITAREVLIRGWMAVDKTLPEYLWLSSYHDITAAFFIATGLDADDEWPRIFGPVAAASTVRGYWGVFWHRIIYRSFGGYAGVVLKWGGVRRGTVRYRVWSNAVVFALSAVLHGAVSQGMGNRCAWGRSLGYWMLQPVAFVLEGVVQACWAWWLGRIGVDRGRRGVRVLERVVGFVWVFAWFFWCVPKRIYPLQYCGV